MNVVLPDDIESKLISSLREGLADNLGSLSALKVLSVLPMLAQSDEMQRLLEAVLHRAPYGYRVIAAKVLHRLDNPLGAVHLAYNSVRFHPVLKEDHFKISGWHDYTVPVAKELDSCLDLLLDDAIGSGRSHAMTLSQRAPEEIFPTLLPALSHHAHAARNAAYVLALMGEASVLPTIEEWLYADPYPRAAIVAMSHLPGTHAAPALRKFLNKWLDKRDPLQWIRNEALHRLSVVSGEKTCTEVLREYAMPLIAKLRVPSATKRDVFEEIALSEPVRAFSISPFIAPYPANFLWEFASPDERMALAAEQKRAVQAILNQLDDISLLQDCSGCHFLKRLAPTGRNAFGRDDYYKTDGFYVDYDADDYLAAATAWIERPQEYVDPHDSMILQQRPKQTGDD